MIFKDKLESKSMALILLLIMGCSGTRPGTVGQFAPCPDKPNCFSSKSRLKLNKIAPFTYKGTLQKANEKLLAIVKSMPRTRIITENDFFFHAEFTSKRLGFVDDVEFYFEEPGTVHFRSASRIGYSDMGANRERMEKVRRLFR